MNAEYRRARCGYDMTATEAYRRYVLPSYTPTHLCEWSHPDSYIGATWAGYYSSGFGRSRDSDALERANFDAAARKLLPLAIDIDDEPSVQIVRESHWAVGWVEWIAIHSEDSKALRVADKLQERVADYPILDESRHSEYEWEECAETWERAFDASDRVRYLRDHSYTAGSFADVLAAIRGSWYHAANILHCPSDLIH